MNINYEPNEILEVYDMAKAVKPSENRIIKSGEVAQHKGICMTPHLTGKLIFFYEWCKNCGICVMVCPSKALAEDNEGAPYLAEPDKCKFCSLCWRICPDFAVMKNPNWEEGKNAS